MTPKRIQRKRTKGWRMPENTVYVGRGTRWGNPWTIKGAIESGLFRKEFIRKMVYKEYEAWLTKKHWSKNECFGNWADFEKQREWIYSYSRITM